MADHDIFLSYSRRDLAVVEQFREQMEAGGYRLWFDKKKIRTGDNWKRALAVAIDEAQVLIWMVSRESCASEVCSQGSGTRHRQGERHLYDLLGALRIRSSFLRKSSLTWAMSMPRSSTGTPSRFLPTSSNPSPTSTIFAPGLSMKNAAATRSRIATSTIDSINTQNSSIGPGTRMSSRKNCSATPMRSHRKPRSLSWCTVPRINWFPISGLR